MIMLTLERGHPITKVIVHRPDTCYDLMLVLETRSPWICCLSWGIGLDHAQCRSGNSYYSCTKHWNSSFLSIFFFRMSENFIVTCLGFKKIWSLKYCHNSCTFGARFVIQKWRNVLIWLPILLFLCEWRPHPSRFIVDSLEMASATVAKVLERMTGTLFFGSSKTLKFQNRLSVT